MQKLVFKINDYMFPLALILERCYVSVVNNTSTILVAKCPKHCPQSPRDGGGGREDAKDVQSCKKNYLVPIDIHVN